MKTDVYIHCIKSFLFFFYKNVIFFLSFWKKKSKTDLLKEKRAKLSQLLYLPMFFILIFASGGISSGSLYTREKTNISYFSSIPLHTTFFFFLWVGTYIIIFVKNWHQLFWRKWWHCLLGFLEQVRDKNKVKQLSSIHTFLFCDITKDILIFSKS